MQHATCNMQKVKKIVDFAIVGGGIMGCSTAFHLSKLNLISNNNGKNHGKIVVLERDMQYKLASTPRSVGSIRQQFSLPENVLMSLHSSKFFQSISNEISGKFDGKGYLFLAGSDNGASILEENQKMQASLGAKVELITPTELKNLYPWMNVDDVKLGALGTENEGWVDPYLLNTWFRESAIKNGVELMNANVTNVSYDESNKLFIINNRSHINNNNNDEETTIAAKNVINACGAWSAESLGPFAQLHQRSTSSGKGGMVPMMIPVRKRKRMVFSFQAEDSRPQNVLVVDPSGVYFRPEGCGYVCGKSPTSEEEDPDWEEENDREFSLDENFFVNEIWPHLANRVPSFDSIKLQRGCGWAGLYDYNIIDHNAIIGEIIPGYYIISGFSGHGLQQSYAAGRGLAELIIQGKYSSIDLSRLSPHRFRNDNGDSQLMFEKNII